MIRLPRLQWPLRRAVRLTITLRSGRQLRQECWNFRFNCIEGSDEVTATNWTFAGRAQQLRLVRADQIAAVQVAKGRLHWRGWRR